MMANYIVESEKILLFGSMSKLTIRFYNLL
jgi:hypothetical protein